MFGCACGTLLTAACGGADSKSVSPPDAAGVLDVDSGPITAVDASSPSSPDASMACQGKPAQPQGDATWTITTAGGSRTALVHIPPGYDPTRATPLVLNFHGYSGSPSQEEQLTKMNTASDAAGYLLVYPQGTGSLPSWNAGACCGTAAQSNLDDVGFVASLLDSLEDQLCVDSKRVFATGMSNGGFLAQRLGCELADRIAAIAPVAGVLGIKVCNPSRPVPIIEFHGTSDSMVPYGGDPSISYPSVADTVAGWVQRDDCPSAATTTYSKGDATCVTYGPCSAGAEVTLCTIAGGGHTWPGGTPFPLLGNTSTDLSATDAMWTFFQAHPM
jgi:polyhydroxybutyrate depolymerase